jgi:hypothetical protein
MGTGVTFSPSPPDCIYKETYFAFAKNFIPSKLDNVKEEVNHIAFCLEESKHIG